MCVCVRVFTAHTRNQITTQTDIRSPNLHKPSPKFPPKQLPKVAALTRDPSLVVEALGGSSSVTVGEDKASVRPNIKVRGTASVCGCPPMVLMQLGGPLHA